MEVLKNDFVYFIDNQGALLKKYNGKFIVIKNKEVVDSFDTLPEAYNTAVKKFGLGNFLIQHCVTGNSAYTQSYHSRVSFH